MTEVRKYRMLPDHVMYATCGNRSKCAGALCIKDAEGITGNTYFRFQQNEVRYSLGGLCHVLSGLPTKVAKLVQEIDFLDTEDKDGKRAIVQKYMPKGYLDFKLAYLGNHQVETKTSAQKVAINTRRNAQNAALRAKGEKPRDYRRFGV